MNHTGSKQSGRTLLTLDMLPQARIILSRHSHNFSAIWGAGRTTTTTAHSSSARCRTSAAVDGSLCFSGAQREHRFCCPGAPSTSARGDLLAPPGRRRMLCVVAASRAQPTKAYSPLHYNIEDFAVKVVPTEGERRMKLQVVEDLKLCVRKAFPNQGVDVKVFGSFANGLSCWNSDLDIVITGLMRPGKSGGYDLADRGKVTSKLRRVCDLLRQTKKADVKSMLLIPRARIPLLKITMRSRICVDVSISDDNGPLAAKFITQQTRQFPSLKPLVLVLKTFLKAQHLNEVNTGGLSSYSLTNMVIAHLQEELKAGNDVYDLGETLYTFLLRYGEEFNYEHEAVSVSSGGIVPKMSLGFAMESARQAAISMGSYDSAVGWQERLCVDCPLSGRDVSSGTFRIDLVRSAMVTAARKLEALARGRPFSDTSVNYLQALFDVQHVLRRTPNVKAQPQKEKYFTTVPASDEEEVVEALSDPDTDSLLVIETDDEAGGQDMDDDDVEEDHLHRTPTQALAAKGDSKGRRRS